MNKYNNNKYIAILTLNSVLPFVLKVKTDIL